MEVSDSRRSELEMDGLSLIDVSSEDDSLLLQSFGDSISDAFAENERDEVASGFMGNEHENDKEISIYFLEEKEKFLKPQESPEPEKAQNRQKYNLRKSLAWDKAFFTSAGFLDPDELSSMIESNQTDEKQTLRTIQEDIHKSTESVSTLHSDNLTGETIESGIYEEIEEPIQKPNEAFDTKATSSSKKVGAKENASAPSLSKVAPASRDKLSQVKPKVTPKKPSSTTQGPGKAAKQVSLRPPVPQPASIKGASSASTILKPPRAFSKVSPMPITSTKRASLDPAGVKGASSASTILKPPKAFSKVSPMPMPITSTKRASLDVNRVKLRKDTKAAGGELAPALKAKNLLSRPIPLPRSYLRTSSANKGDVASSCSSLESCSSASSGISHKSTSKSIGTKNDANSRSVNSASLGSTARAAPRVGPRNANQTRNRHFLAHGMPKAKLSAKTLPANTISECQSESSASSAHSEEVDISKAVQKTGSCTSSPAKDDAPNYFHCQNSSTDQSSVAQNECITGSGGEIAKRAPTANGGLVHTASTRPSGLRMPTPKIGFFDGVKSMSRTPTGKVQPRAGAVNGSARIGSHSPSGSLTGATPRKVQLSRSPSPGALMSATKGANALHVSVNVTLFSPKAQNRMSTSTGCKELKDNNGGSGVDDSDLKEANLVFAEKSKSSTLQKDKGQSERKGNAEPKGIKMNPGDKVMKSSVDGSAASADENANPSMKMGDKKNEKDEVSAEDQVSRSTKESRDLALTCGRKEQRITSPTNPPPSLSVFNCKGPKKTPLEVKTSTCSLVDEEFYVSGGQAEAELTDSLCSVENVLAGYN